MFKSFLISMFAVFLFAMGATGSWFYLNMSPKDAEGDDLATAQETSPFPMSEANPIPRMDSAEDFPAPVRGSAASAEEIFRLNLAQDARIQQLRQQEERIREQGLRIKTADTDTKAAQREVEGMLTQMSATLAAAEKLFEEIKLAAAQLAEKERDVQKKTEELKVLQDEADQNELANIKTLGEYFQSMPPSVAAEVIKEFVNDGEMDFAINLLRKIEPRNVSKILAEINDAALISDITVRYPEVRKLR
jgi:flagellar motility protein MotE (MotC chaperone)